jgi:renalase
VIGAGLAGLSCATALQAAGHQVSMFEKSRGAAGRMSTRRGDTWHGDTWHGDTWQCDHGAQYFTARSDAFVAELARWLQAGVAEVWAPRLTIFGEASQHRQDATLKRYVGLPAMTSPAQWLASSLTEPVNFGRRIEALVAEGEGWRLQLEAGAVSQRFDAVVLALPAPQAAALLAQAAPALARRAEAVRMRACWALMLNFAQVLDLGFDAAFVNQGPLRWVARNSSKPGRSGTETWLLHARAEWSEAHVECSAEQAAAAMQQAFEALGAPAAQAWTAGFMPMPRLYRRVPPPRAKPALGTPTLAWACAATG